MTDWQRLEQIIKWTGLSTNAFGAAIGLKRAENLYQIKRGNNRISKDVATMIARKYPVVNRSWLLTGDGEMFSPAFLEEAGAPVAPRGIPYYNTDVVRLACDLETKGTSATPAYYINLPGYEDCDFAAICTSDSLSPEIPAGAIVILKEADATMPVMPGEVYLAVLRDAAMLRYVQLDRTRANWLQLTGKPDSGEEPVSVPRGYILRLCLVKGIVTRRVL